MNSEKFYNCQLGGNTIENDLDEEKLRRSKRQIGRLVLQVGFEAVDLEIRDCFKNNLSLH